MKLKSFFREQPQAVLGFLVLFIALANIFHTGFSDSSQTIWSTDYKLALHRNYSEMAQSFQPQAWDATYFLGGITDALIYPNWPLIGILPVGLSMWLNVMLHFMIAGIGAWVLCRKMQIGNWGAALATVGFGLTSHLLSLTHAGHIYKIQSLPWIPWVFAYYYAGWKQGSYKSFIASAMFFALSFQGGEPQVPFYSGLFLALFTPLLLTQKLREGASMKQVGTLFSLSALCAILTVLLALQCLSKYADVKSSYKNLGELSASTTEDKAAKEKQKYDFATGWSFPPEDTSTFLMTHKVRGGLTPAYFGRLGTEDFKLRLNDDFMGVAICIFALTGLAVGRKHEAYPFLLILLVVSLFVGFGRYTPVYKLVYQLPTMASQRAPARWIFFSSLPICIFAGIGFEHFIKALINRDKRWIALPVGILAMLLIVLMVGRSLGIHSQDFAQKAFGPEGSISSTPNPSLQKLRTENVLAAFTRTETLLFLSLLISAPMVWVSVHKTRGSLIVIYACSTLFIALASVDLSLNGKNFIQFYDWQAYHRGNAIIQHFKADKGIFRIQPLGTQAHPAINQIVGPIGRWNGLLFTEAQEAHRVKGEFAAMQQMLKTKQLPHQLNPRWFDLHNVKYLLSAYKLPTDLLKACRLTPDKQYNFNQPGPLFIYRYEDFKPFVQFTASANHTDSDDEALIAACKTKASNPIIYSPLVEDQNLTSQGMAKVLKMSKGGIKIKSRQDGDGWIVVHTLFSKDWKARVNGKKVSILKSHGLYPAIPVPAGDTQIELLVSRFSFKHMAMISTWVLCIVVLISKPTQH